MLPYILNFTVNSKTYSPVSTVSIIDYPLKHVFQYSVRLCVSSNRYFQLSVRLCVSSNRIFLLECLEPKVRSRGRQKKPWSEYSKNLSLYYLPNVTFFEMQNHIQSHETKVRVVTGVRQILDIFQTDKWDLFR